MPAPPSVAVPVKRSGLPRLSGIKVLSKATCRCLFDCALALLLAAVRMVSCRTHAARLPSEPRSRSARLKRPSGGLQRLARWHDDPCRIYLPSDSHKVTVRIAQSAPIPHQIGSEHWSSGDGQKRQSCVALFGAIDLNLAALAAGATAFSDSRHGRQRRHLGDG